MATIVGLTFEPQATNGAGRAMPPDATKADLTARLAELGVDAPSKANKQQLWELLAVAEAG